MPKIQQLEIAPGSLRNGDVIRDVIGEVRSGIRALRDWDAVVAERPKVGSVNATVETDRGRVVIDRGTVVVVDREVLTDEEKLRQREGHFIEELNRRRARLQKRLRDVTEEFTKAALTGEWLDRVVRVAEEAVEIRVELRYLNAVSGLLTEGENGVETATEAARLVREEAQRDLLRLARRGGSVSTSEASNLAGRLEAGVIAGLLDSFGALESI